MFWQLILSLLVTSSASIRPLSQLTVRIDSRISERSCLETLNNLDTLLHLTSTALHNVTQLNMERVTVILPPAWNKSECTQGRSLVPRSKTMKTESDIVIAPTPQQSIESLQFGGCGVRSRRVIFPHHKLHKVQSEIGSFSTQLLGSLLKHEFGYFDSGVSGLDDPQLQEDFSEDENCNEDPFKDTDYNPEALSKQNILCQEQSALDMIQSRISEVGSESSSDASSSSITFGSPSIEYVISHSFRRHLLVLDRSQQSKHVWKHLRNALYR